MRLLRRPMETRAEARRSVSAVKARGGEREEFYGYSDSINKIGKFGSPNIGP